MEGLLPVYSGGQGAVLLSLQVQGPLVALPAQQLSHRTLRVHALLAAASPQPQLCWGVNVVRFVL
jgi:hypothetical protein